jgi:DNA polymerase elongation subunit (family B)
MNLTNIASVNNDIFVFARNEEKDLKITRYEGFFPYYFALADGPYRSYDNKKLKKVLCSKASDVSRAQRFGDIYEGDLRLVKQFMLDKIDVIPPSPIKIAFLDIETQSTSVPDTRIAPDPISCISIYNSFTKNIQTFFLPDFENEKQMFYAFIAYMKKEKYDIWASWNVVFDYNYMFNRMKQILREDFNLAQAISPIQQERYHDGIITYPCGMSIIDYMLWFQKLTLNRERAYTLDYVAQKYLGCEPKKKVDFKILNEDLKEHNREDVLKLGQLEEQKKLFPYYDEIRRLCLVEWEDLIYTSRMIDSLLLQEAKKQKIVLPMKPKNVQEDDKIEFEGAYREIFETGRFENVYKADLSSAYPTMICDFCLDTANIHAYEGIEINGTKFKQTEGAILPMVIKKLLVLKNNIKAELTATSVEDPNYQTIEVKYAAIKGLINSAYGTAALQYFRLFDVRVASATTFLVRSLLHYVIDKLALRNVKVIYVDTDGIEYLSDKDLTPYLNELIDKWALDVFHKGKVTVRFSSEGKFEQLLLLALCRYVGRVRKPNGELETELRGVELKRKDSSNFIVAFQTELLNKILDNEPKETIFQWLREKIESFPKQSLKDISIPCRLARRPEDYKVVPIFVRGMEATPEIDINVGDSFYYLYMAGQDEKKKENVKIFTDEKQDHIKLDEINWQHMVERNIISKITVIFEALKWNLEEVYQTPVKPPKKAPKCSTSDDNQPKKGRGRPKKIKEIIGNPLTSIKKDDIIKEL